MAENEAAHALRIACDEAVTDPKLKPETDARGNVVKTKCNFAVQRIAKVAGYEGFADMVANEICDLMAKSPEWGPLDAKKASIAASQGLLVVAAHKYEPHGHVAVVYPGGALVYAGKWKVDCPVVANVGRENKVCGANWAFHASDTPPTYYCWTKKA